MKIYENYGVLAHEKTPVYTVGSKGTEAYNVYHGILPEGYTWGEGVYETSYIQCPGGYKSPTFDILSRESGPVFFDADKEQWLPIRLEAIND